MVTMTSDVSYRGVGGESWPNTPYDVSTASETMPYRLGEARGSGEPAVGDISRRDLLRKDALLGGSVLWVVPVVQTIGIGQAFARTELVSPEGNAI